MSAVVLNFFGSIDMPATTRLRNAICGFMNEVVPLQDGAVQKKYDTLFLLMCSEGGKLEDGFSLYNFLRLCPIKLVTVNMGHIASIANIPFLAGDERIACPNTYFHFHTFDWSITESHTMTRQQYIHYRQKLDIAHDNKMVILKDRTKLTDADVKALDFLAEPVIHDAGFALENGIIHEIKMPDIPAGTPFFNVDY